MFGLEIKKTKRGHQWLYWRRSSSSWLLKSWPVSQAGYPSDIGMFGFYITLGLIIRTDRTFRRRTYKHDNHGLGPAICQVLNKYTVKIYSAFGGNTRYRRKLDAEPLTLDSAAARTLA